MVRTITLYNERLTLPYFLPTCTYSFFYVSPNRILVTELNKLLGECKNSKSAGGLFETCRQDGEFQLKSQRQMILKEDLSRGQMFFECLWLPSRNNIFAYQGYHLLENCHHANIMSTFLCYSCKIYVVFKYGRLRDGGWAWGLTTLRYKKENY
jgi:hypothetical protein